MKKSVPIVENIFTWPDAEPKLLVTRCKSCKVIAFPQADYCPSCVSSDVEKVFLNRRGILRNFTSVRSRPPEYKGEIPYGVGIAEFDERVRVLGLLTTSDLSQLKPGMEVEVVVEKVYEENGADVVSYKFRPIRD